MTVLVVDDDARFRRTVTMLLRDRGYDVVGEAGGSDEGLAVAAELDPDAVLLDVNLADGDGVELAGRLCAGSDRPRVLLTSSDRDAVPPELLEACPARGFVPKPDIAAADLDRYFGG